MGNKIKAAADIHLVGEKKELTKSKSSKKGKKVEKTAEGDTIEHVEEEPEDESVKYAIYFKWTGKDAAQAAEYKKGRFGNYHSAEIKEGNRSTVVLLPKGSYQLRFRVDGVGYLCPNQISPTILRKFIELLQKESDKYLGGFDLNIILGDGSNDPQLEQLPDGKIKDLLIKLQALMPCDKFSIKPKFQKKSGKWPQGKRYLNFDQQSRRFIRKKSEDPVVRATAKIAARKAAIEAVRYGLSQAGLTFDEAFHQLEEALGVDFNHLPFDLDTNLDNLDQPFGEDDVNEIYETYADAKHDEEEEQLPEKLKASASKRPRVARGNHIPTRFFWAEIAGGTDISCVYWKAEKPDKQYTVKLEKLPVPEEKTKGFIPGYQGIAGLSPGKYRYRWMVDGKGYYKPTRPTDDHPQSGKSFRIRLIHTAD